MKSKIPCDVIKDLLPLYVDGLVSENTGREVESHIDECVECSNVLKSMQNPESSVTEEEEKEIKFLRKNRRRNQMILFLSVVCSVILVAALGMFFYKRGQVQFDMASFAVEAGRGDTFLFGVYEQDGNLDNGPEPIEWIVLRNKDGVLYAMSKYGLENKPYHDQRETVTWENCSLRQWLNGSFYDNAFSTEEKTMIMETELRNPDNPYYGTEGGNDTLDKVFLLGYNEYEPQTFGYQLCTPTVYGESQDIHIDTRIAIQCRWWLRTPGIQGTTATFGSKDLGAQSIGIPVDSEGLAVRPCIQIKY